MTYRESIVKQWTLPDYPDEPGNPVGLQAELVILPEHGPGLCLRVIKNPSNVETTDLDHHEMRWLAKVLAEAEIEITERQKK